ncbi:unnamed protein product [Leuciscus chuanchicus]
MDSELQINPSNSDDDLFRNSPPSQSVRSSQQSLGSQNSQRLRSVVEIPQSRGHSRHSSSSKISPTPTRQDHSPLQTRTTINDRHRHESRRDRSPRQPRHHSTNRSNSQRTHATSPRPENTIKNWTVARLQRALKDKGIHFSRSDNKSRLFQLYTASTHTSNLNSEPPTLPGLTRDPLIVTHDNTTLPPQRPQPAVSAPPSGDQALTKEDDRSSTKEAEWYATTSTILAALFPTVDSYTPAPSAEAPTQEPLAPTTQLLYPTDYYSISAHQSSPIGIATRKYSGKKRLIIDLSSPHGSHIPSINSIIPAPDFSMKYASIDQAITLIRKAGHGARLSKADITSAFKVLPIHPEFWRFFGIFWKGAYYFSVCLTFGCRSSPKIFDSLSEALCWILINNHRLPYVLHLLDDFLIITPTSAPPHSGLSTLVTVFSRTRRTPFKREDLRALHLHRVSRHHPRLHLLPSISTS